MLLHCVGPTTVGAALGVVNVEGRGERLKSSRQSRPPTDHDKVSKKSSRQGTASNSIADQPKRVPSGSVAKILEIYMINYVVWSLLSISSFIYSYMPSIIHSFLSFIPSFIPAFIDPFVHSFNYSFIHAYHDLEDALLTKF